MQVLATLTSTRFYKKSARRKNDADKRKKTDIKEKYAPEGETKYNLYMYR